MSATTTSQAHIAYELINDIDPEVVVIEFLSHEFASSTHSWELGEQLQSLIGTKLPQNFVIDFANVRSLGSTAFGEIVSFARNVRHLGVCNMQDHLRLGASLIGLDEFVNVSADRRVAIHEARRAAMQGQADTVDYPAWGDESG
jgi:anti-anti-sigma regulatory factor